MTPRTFDVKFPRDTQLTFGSLTFAAEENGNLKMLPPGAAPERIVSTHGKDLCRLTTSSTSGSACTCSDSCAGLYICTAKLIWGIPVMTSILRPSTRASSSSSSATSLYQDSSDDYPKIGVSTCGDYAKEGRLIFMVTPTRDPSHNNSNRYPTIGRLETSDAQTPNNGMIQNLNLNFNAMQFQTIIESIQCMAPEGSPLVALAKQNAKDANLIIAERSADNP
jgi:hypothetical protein